MWKILAAVVVASSGCAGVTAPTSRGPSLAEANPWPASVEATPDLNERYAQPESRRVTVTVLGASKTTAATERFEEWAAALAAQVVGSGGHIVTGAGKSGIMGAAFNAAREAAQADGAGENLTIIRVPPWEEVDFDGGRAIGAAASEAERVEKFVRVSATIVVFPGGAGTSFEIAKLVLMLQYPPDAHSAPQRVVLVGADYWRGLLDQLGTQAEAGQISRAAVAKVEVVDDRTALLAVAPH